MKNEEPGIIDNVKNNLQLEIKDVVIRFEDSVSNPKYNFVVAVIIEQLLMKCTDKTFNENSTGKMDDLTYHLFKVKGFSAYFDFSRQHNKLEIDKQIVQDIVDKYKKEESFMLETFPFYCYCLSEVCLIILLVNYLY